MPEIELSQASPGTVVPTGAQIAPAGQTGTPGTVGTNAFTQTMGSFTVPPIGNTALVMMVNASWMVVGELVWVDQAGGGAGQPAVMQVTNLNGNQVTLMTIASGAPFALADATQSGLMRQVSGNTTDFIDGTNHSQPIGPVIVGAPAGTPAPVSSILVPAYATHPDTVWTYGAFDDHFEGSSLAVKWAKFPGTSPVASIDQTAQQIYVFDSQLCLNGSAGANDNIQYVNPYISQVLPNANPFSISFKTEAILATNRTASAFGSNAGFYTQISTATNYVAKATVFNLLIAPNATPTGICMVFYWGPNASSGNAGVYIHTIPRYWKWVMLADYTIALYFSTNGKHWSVASGFGTSPGFSAGNPPVSFIVGCTYANYGGATVSIDWVKFTNP